MQEWKRTGLLIGAFFYILTMVILPLLTDETLSIVKIILGIPLWVVTGMAAAYLLKDRRKNNKTTKKKAR